jgi:dTDP-L-rhamnose 4-epimerase
MASILITGGAGFIGSHTADALIALGHRVRVLDSLEPQVHPGAPDFPASLNPAVERLLGDVRDPAAVREAVAGAQVVYHFAALTGVGQSMYERARYEEVNVGGTVNLLKALADAKQVERIVLASSRAVYGEGTHRCARDGIVHPSVRRRDAMERGDFSVHCPGCGDAVTAIPTPERRPLRPVSIYGQTKARQERLVLEFERDLRVPAVCLRYFNVYGSRQSLQNPYTGVISIFYSRLREGRDLEIYERGTPTRDFVHVSDVVRANVLAFDAQLPARSRINVGTGVATSLRDVATRLATLLGVSDRISIRDVDTFRAGDLSACHADLRRARRILGYEPSVGLDEGLREFVAWAGGEQSVDRLAAATAELSEHDVLGGTGVRVA